MPSPQPTPLFFKKTIRVSKTVSMPDVRKIALYKKAPELGPKMLFFSGGSALAKFSRALINYTHNSIHIITPFDSGGSSAELRNTFNMLAVGDLRSRLMALADQSVQGNPEVYRLFSYRLPNDMENKKLAELIDCMIDGSHPLVSDIHDPMRKIIRSHLQLFRQKMPGNFNLSGASIGNLILTGGYLNNNRHIDPVIFLFSKLVEARGIVRPVVSQHLHLMAELENGDMLSGQNLFSGNDIGLPSPIKKIYLSESLEQANPTTPPIRKKITNLISQTELICYPMGSFYSSIIANLLPGGVCKAISENDCPKVYVPNAGLDPEQHGLTLDSMVETLIAYLKQGHESVPPVKTLLNFVLVDLGQENYPGPYELKKIEQMGVEIIDTQLVSEKSKPYIDEDLLSSALLSLV